MENKKLKPTTLQAVSPLAVMIILLTVGVGIFKLRAEPIILDRKSTRLNSSHN